MLQRSTPVSEFGALSLGSTLLELPFILTAAWWNAACGLFLSCPDSSPAIVDDVQHEQLVVPDVIEEEGEHALFA